MTRYLVTQTQTGTRHWAKRGWTVTLCGLPRRLWRYSEKRQIVNCDTCRKIKAGQDAISAG